MKRGPVTLGAGLLYGMCVALLAWLAIAGITAAQSADNGQFFAVAAAALPELVSFVLFFGAALALCVAILSAVARAKAAGEHHSLSRAILTGGFAGLVGGWAFGTWMASIHYFPLIAGLVHSRSTGVGLTLHFAIAFTIGSSFGLLFSRAVTGYGQSIVAGAAYGFFWWFLGPLTLLPLLSHRPVNWSNAHASVVFGSLVGHVIYGMIVGLFYAAADRFWVLLFIDSDPLRRRRAGVAGAALQSLRWGTLASLLGGLLFSVVMIATGVLGRVANLVGGRSAVLGFFVHMGISAIVGVTYAILFRKTASSYGDALGWGATYGLLWWFIGPLTLFPIFLGGTFRWTVADAHDLLPSMIGHIVYGAAMASVLFAIERRYELGLRGPSFVPAEPIAERYAGTTVAPTTWFIVLGFGMLLPVVLG